MYRQEEEPEEEEEEEEAAAGEDLCHLSAYNRSPSRARSPNEHNSCGRLGMVLL